MAIVQNFSASQVLGASNEILLTDTSTGADVAVVSRRVYLTDKDGNYYTEGTTPSTTVAYSTWGNFPGTTTLILDVLTADKCLNVRVDWVNVSGTVLYTKTTLTLFYLYARTYRIFLVKSQSSNTKLPDRANFYYNSIRLNCSIQEAITSVEDMSDIASAQAALIRAKKLIDNPSYFY